MKRQLVITERAHQDIERNAVWWARNYSLTQVIDWQDAVYRQIRAMHGASHLSIDSVSLVRGPGSRLTQVLRAFGT
jgi:hypothetical protein